MKAFARFIVRRSVAWAVVLFVLGLSATAVLYASKVVQDDDMLAFLPKQNKEVAQFTSVSERFGSLDVALVGIESDDVFEPEFLRRLQALTTRLNETEGLDYTLSITSVDDFEPNKAQGGITTGSLVREIPSNDEEKAALREKVLSRDHAVGNLVSSDGRAVMLYCFATPNAQPRVTAGKVRSLVEEFFPNEKKYWGGAPFISTYIYDVTQKDLKRLAPWACLAIALIVLLSFKDLVGTGLSLLSTLLGVVIPLGVMGFLGVHTNIVLGSMPVILFALGSAYAVHLLTRFYGLAATLPREEALVRALEQVGPSILGSGLTTVFGLLSFVMMDIAPMRTFGVFTALGLTIALALSLTFVPAVLVLSPIKGRAEPSLVWLSKLMARLSVWARRRRALVGAFAIVLTAVSCFYSTRVDSRMDTASFFDAGSPPDEADAFLRRHFGGSQFIQVQVDTDLSDPAALRQLQLLADRIALLDGVSSVTHIGAIVAQVNEAWNAVRRVPDTTEQVVKDCYPYLTGKRAVSQTVTDDRSSALIHVKVVPTRAAEVEKILHEVERVAKETMPADAVIASAQGSSSDEAGKQRAEIVAARIAALALQFGSRVSAPQLRDALLRQQVQPDPAEIEKELVAFIGSKPFRAELTSDPEGAQIDAGAAARIARAVAALGPPPPADTAEFERWRAGVRPAVGAALGKDPSDQLVDDAGFALNLKLGDLWNLERARAPSRHIIEAGGLTVPEGPRGQRFRNFVGHALLDLGAPTVLLPRSSAAADAPAAKLDVTVTGLPVLYRGLSDSVFKNQWNSLWFALVLVIGLKALLFRSLTTGLLSSVPTILTLLIIYGGMGLAGVHLDIGTSMLASLIIGAGDDYAVQYLWSWSVPPRVALEKAAEVAALENGAGIWTNAIMVAVGFFVLTLGEARPLQNVGALTAAAMLAAALATFIICPLLANRRHYAPIPAPEEATESFKATRPSHAPPSSAP